MDPTMEPSRQTAEETKTVGPAGSQKILTKRTETPDQTAAETRTVATGPGGATVRHEQVIGMAPGAAKIYSQKKGMFRTYQVIWYLLGLVEIILAFRFFLKLAGANPNGGFTNFVYGLSDPFAGPFLNTFYATPNQGAVTTSFFEWSTLVAGFVYALVAWGLVKLMQLMKPTNPEEVERTVEGQ